MLLAAIAQDSVFLAVNLNAPEISVVDKVAIVKVPVVPIQAPVENNEEEEVPSSNTNFKE